MDEFTFGNSKAAIDLAKMVAEKYPKSSRMVGKYLSEMNRNLFLLATCHNQFKYDMGMLESMMLMCRNFHYERVKKQKNIPPEVKSFVINLMVTRYRAWFKVVTDYKKKYLVELNKNNERKSNIPV